VVVDRILFRVWHFRIDHSAGGEHSLCSIFPGHSGTRRFDYGLRLARLLPLGWSQSPKQFREAINPIASVGTLSFPLPPPSLTQMHL
jgi:hypothetical protein